MAKIDFFKRAWPKVTTVTPNGMFVDFFLLRRKINQMESREAKPTTAVGVMVGSQFIILPEKSVKSDTLQ